MVRAVFFFMTRWRGTAVQRLLAGFVQMSCRRPCRV